MSDAAFATNRENYCYRHPDRQSFVLCQRCTRTICPECQTRAAVGVVCPECMKQQQASRTPAQRRAERRWGRGGSLATAAAQGQPVVTYALVGITVIVSLLQLLLGGVNGQVGSALLFAGVYVDPQFPQALQPWRAFTVTLVHGGIPHLALNMLSLYMLGRVVEPMIGSWRFLSLYLISALAGSMTGALLDPLQPVVGASGAIFGVFGMLLIFTRSLGGNMVPLLIVLGVNLVYGFIVSGIAWQAHVGGLVGGALVGAIFLVTRKPTQHRLQVVLLIALAVLLAATAFLIPMLHPIAIP